MVGLSTYITNDKWSWGSLLLRFTPHINAKGLLIISGKVTVGGDMKIAGPTVFPFYKKREAEALSCGGSEIRVEVFKS